MQEGSGKIEALGVSPGIGLGRALKIEEATKSPFADLINAGGRYGGATFATIFLSNFVDKDIPWAHLDIAGVDFMEKEWGVYGRGASGFGVRTCLDYLINL